MYMPVSGSESTYIAYQINPVPDLHDTRTRNRRQKMKSIYGAGFCSVCHGCKPRSYNKSYSAFRICCQRNNSGGERQAFSLYHLCCTVDSAISADAGYVEYRRRTLICVSNVIHHSNFTLA